MVRAENNWWTELETISDREECRKIEEKIYKKLNEGGFNKKSMFGVRVIFEEALVNAIKHGNKNNRDKKIKVRYRIVDNRLEASIEDEGEGFSLEKVPDCTSKKFLPRASGRGICLMKYFAKTLEYPGKGNIVYFEVEKKKE